MTKRQRIEDLGKISVLLKHCMDNKTMFDHATSKHSLESFLERFKNEEKLADLHDEIRWLKSSLEEIQYLAEGDDDL